jgi:RNA methyltransferase, TrmH family
MVSKNQLKFIKSLKIKKYRVQESLFLIEGRKNVLELLNSSFDIEMLLVTETFMQSHGQELSGLASDKVFIAKAKDLEDIGTFQSNQECLAVAKMFPRSIDQLSYDDHIVVLDGVSDPGNLGTIIRTLDWFGFKQVVCSQNCTEFYNPKVISSTMGSFARVEVYYTDLVPLFQSMKRPIIGAVLEGKSPEMVSFDQPSFLVMGSESHGISDEVMPLLTEKVTIPSFGNAESLNVGIATGILAYLLRR